MADTGTTLRRRVKAAHRTFRELKMIAKGLLSMDHPMLAHIIPMRRCNLACAYCNEYDDFSKPVPLEDMYRRVDKLAELGTTIITISGGETLLHPELDDIIRRIRSARHHRRHDHQRLPADAAAHPALNRAGLDHLQISIDNVMPDEVSKKSPQGAGQEAAIAGRACRISREHQLGGRRRRVKQPQDALTIGKRAVELGFTSTVGIIHDGTGQLRPLDKEAQTVFAEIHPASCHGSIECHNAPSRENMSALGH